jgi:hypothetical protein
MSNPDNRYQSSVRGVGWAPPLLCMNLGLDSGNNLLHGEYKQKGNFQRDQKSDYRRGEEECTEGSAQVRRKSEKYLRVKGVVCLVNCGERVNGVCWLHAGSVVMQVQ